MRMFVEGQRVQVVKDEVDAAFVGEQGVISFSRRDGGWYVILDNAPNIPIPYEDSDLAPVNITVIEGVADKSIHGKTMFHDDWLDNHFDFGKRYRITIEEVGVAEDSATPTKATGEGA